MKKPIDKRVATKKSSVRGATPNARNSAPAKAASAPRAAKNILTAGIKALSSAHDEAIARQGRMFESILGLNGRRDPADPPTGKPDSSLAAALDPFGFRKFEDVFDQRVARALANLGVPTAEAIADLTAEVERLRAKVSALEAQAKKR